MSPASTVRGMGRPKSDQPHRQPIQVKLSEEERALADRAADKAGLPTSTWMRTVVLREARRVLKGDPHERPKR